MANLGLHFYFDLIQHFSKKLFFAGLLTWSRGATLVDIEAELNTLSDCAPPGEEARGGETTHHLSSFKNWEKRACDFF